MIQHTLLNISRSKDNQEMEFNRSIKYSMKKTFLEISCLRSLLVFLKALYKVKTSAHYLL